jgi:transposase
LSHVQHTDGEENDQRVRGNVYLAAEESRQQSIVLCSKSLDALSEMLTGDPTLYLSQLKKALWDDYGVKVSTASICRAIHLPVKQGGLGLSLQKLEKRAMQRNMKERMEWIDRINRGDFDHKTFLSWMSAV